MLGKETEQHTIEEVGWLHHAWDEVGPQLTTGICLIIAAFVTVWAKHKFFPSK